MSLPSSVDPEHPSGLDVVSPSLVALTMYCTAVLRVVSTCGSSARAECSHEKSQILRMATEILSLMKAIGYFGSTHLPQPRTVFAEVSSSGRAVETFGRFRLRDARCAGIDSKGSKWSIPAQLAEARYGRISKREA